jgi:hypothetical protein
LAGLLEEIANMRVVDNDVWVALVPELYLAVLRVHTWARIDHTGRGSM